MQTAGVYLCGIDASKLPLATNAGTGNLETRPQKGMTEISVKGERTSIEAQTIGFIPSVVMSTYLRRRSRYTELSLCFSHLRIMTKNLFPDDS